MPYKVISANGPQHTFGLKFSCLCVSIIIGSVFHLQDLNEGPKENLSESVVKQMEDFAEKLLSDEIAVYNKRKIN